MSTESCDTAFTKSIHFDRAEEFFQALMPGGTYEDFNKRESLNTVFRGHSDSKYKLIPTALRPAGSGGTLHKLCCNWPNDNSEIDSNVVQLLREHYVLEQFFAIADRIGHALPEDSQALRTRLTSAKFGIIRARKAGQKKKGDSQAIIWPPQELLSLMALAQHRPSCRF